MDETILIVSRDPAERERLAGLARQLDCAAWAVDSRKGALAASGRPVVMAVAVVGATAQEDAEWLVRLWGEFPAFTFSANRSPRTSSRAMTPSHFV